MSELFRRVHFLNGSEELPMMPFRINEPLPEIGDVIRIEDYDDFDFKIISRIWVFANDIYLPHSLIYQVRPLKEVLCDAADDN